MMGQFRWADLPSACSSNPVSIGEHVGTALEESLLSTQNIWMPRPKMKNFFPLTVVERGVGRPW